MMTIVIVKIAPLVVKKKEVSLLNVAAVVWIEC